MMNYSAENLKAQGSLDGMWSFNNGFIIFNHIYLLKYELLNPTISSYDTDEITKKIHNERYQTANLVSNLSSITNSVEAEYVMKNVAQYNFFFHSKLKTPLAFQETVRLKNL